MQIYNSLWYQSQALIVIKTRKKNRDWESFPILPTSYGRTECLDHGCHIRRRKLWSL